ncbi:uncharacterized protein VTP21DRAFT_4755 [Calcarisporiella thermophila]|uniref:uncharacterized protein n=1 Tax=Calcarisporiella thermophila TaxID=911321 RepID=UPI0037431953
MTSDFSIPFAIPHQYLPSSGNDAKTSFSTDNPFRYVPRSISSPFTPQAYGVWQNVSDLKDREYQSYSPHAPLSSSPSSYSSTSSSSSSYQQPDRETHIDSSYLPVSADHSPATPLSSTPASAAYAGAHTNKTPSKVRHRTRAGEEEGRPPYSYAALIQQAIESSPQKRMTVAEIYDYFLRNYSYFRTTRATWKNSIRHNLTMKGLFVRDARPSCEPGKGGYWTVNHSASSREKSNSPRDKQSSGGNRAVASRYLGSSPMGYYHPYLPSTPSSGSLYFPYGAGVSQVGSHHSHYSLGGTSSDGVFVNAYQH